LFSVTVGLLGVIYILVFVCSTQNGG